LQHNLQLIKELAAFKSIGCPVLVGPSRKSFIGAILDLPFEERLEGTAAAVTACILNGASIVRVHDVKEMKRVAQVADALKSV
ncbi:MAG: dihydropteroate synthase, partial [Bacteroidota bacterium]